MIIEQIILPKNLLVTKTYLHILPAFDILLSSSTWLDNFLCSDHLEKLLIIVDLQMIDFDIFFYCCQYAPVIPLTMCLFFQMYMVYAYGYYRNTTFLFPNHKLRRNTSMLQP